ncbi:MAG: hypothetical protein RPS47_00685, partial [Colwellia sp.]
MDDKQLEKPWWQPAFIHALPLIALAYTWQGAAIYLPVIALALLLHTTIVSAAGGQVKARAVTRYTLALTIIFLTVNFLFPELVVYSRGMYWLIAGSIGLGVSAWAYTILLAKLTKKRPMLVSCTTLVCLLGGAFLLLYITPIGQNFTSEVLTSKDLFIREEISVNSALYFNRLGSVAVLALVSILIALVMFYKGLIAAQVIIPLTFAYVWLVIWWLSGDFGYLAPAFLSFAATVTLYGGYQLIKAKNLWIKVSSMVAVFMMLFTPLYPLKLVVKPWVDQTKLASSIIYGDEWFEALKWLKSNTPASIGLDDHLQTSNYGVIAAWDFGNIIASHGERIPMASRYPSASLLHWGLAQNEPDSLQQICPKCTKQQGVRYAIVDANSFGPFFYAKTQYVDKPAHLTQIGSFDVNGRSIARYSFGKMRDNSMIARLYAQDGMQLSHYRLIYESPALSYNTALLQLLPENKFNFSLHSFPVTNPANKKTYQAWDKAALVITDDGYLYDDFITSTIKIYQIVKGAQLQGVTTPGARVQARLVLHSLTTDRKFNYQR